MLKKVQMRGGARWPHARRLATLSVRPRAPYLRRWAFFSILLSGPPEVHEARPRPTEEARELPEGAARAWGRRRLRVDGRAIFLGAVVHDDAGFIDAERS